MSQEQDIIYHLRNIGPITPLEALNLYGCFRIASRINELRQQGYDINTTIVSDGNKRYASYSLEPKRIIEQVENIS